MRLAAKLEPNLVKLQMLLKLGWKNFEIYTNRSYITSTGMAASLASFQPYVQYVVHAPTTYFNLSVIDFAHTIGANLVNTHKIVSNEELKFLSNYAEERGIVITVENEAFPESHHLDKHKNPIATIKTYDPIRSAGDFRRLKEKIPNIKLCIDVEHAIIRKEYPEFIYGCCSDINHIHMCGFTGGPHHRPVYENMPLMVEIVTMLKECNYQGFIVCEHDVEFHTTEIWKKTLEECSPLFGE